MKLEDEIYISKDYKKDLLNSIREQHPRKVDISKECIDKGIQFGIEMSVDKIKYRLDCYIRPILEKHKFEELTLPDIDNILEDIHNALFW